MTTDELIVSYAVKINGGSGVLVGALSQEYTYVFTAAHVVGTANQVTRDGTPLRILNGPFLHPTLDCAILQVEFQPDVTQRPWIGEISAGAAVTFVGYPNTNMGTATPYKIYTGQLNSVNSDLIVCNLDNGPQQEAIAGMSGGGVYHIYNGYPYLVGIECRMDDEDENLRWGRIRCILLKPYESILVAHNFAFIAPSFMKCFSQLKDDIFHFNAAKPENVLQLNNKLREYAQALVDAGLPSPHDFMLKQQKKLLVGHEPLGGVLDRDLWIAYFEFVIVCALIDDPDNIDADYLNGLESRRRFVYSSSNAHWIRHLSEMLKAARLALDEHGVMIINSPQEEAPHLPDEGDLEDVIDDIASSPKIGAMRRIDDVHSEVYRTYTVAHMKGLRNEYVLKKHRVYGAASASAQLPLFRDFYNEVIK